MRHRFVLACASALAACSPQTDVVSYGSQPLDEKPDSGASSDAGKPPIDAGAPPIDAGFPPGDGGVKQYPGLKCTLNENGVISILTKNGQVGTLVNNPDQTFFKAPGTAVCQVPSVVSMAVQSDYTVWLANGAGQLWAFSPNGANPCGSLPLSFPAPVLIESVPLKGGEAIYAAAGDSSLTGIDPLTDVHTTFNTTFNAHGPKLIGISANDDGSFWGLTTLEPAPKVEVLSYSAVGDLQSKTDFSLNTGETPIGLATSGSDVFVFSQQNVYDFQPGSGRVVRVLPVPQDILPGIVAVASSRCAFP